NKGNRIWTRPGRLGNPLTNAEEDQYLMDNNLFGRVTRVGAPSLEYNCFGIVFTNGTRILNDPNDVQTILQDNYLRVTMPFMKPRTGDIIIYRSYTGLARHAGLVVGTDPILI